jgi:hypothetical protein
MFLRIFTLLLALVVQASAQDCTLCPGGEAPEFGSFFIFIGNCSDVAANIAATPIGDECRTSGLENFFPEQNLDPTPYMCGCPGVTAGTCSGLCRQGTKLITEGNEFLVAGCQFYDRLFMTVTNQTFCDEIQTENEINSACCVKGNGKGKALGLGMNTRQRLLQAGGEHQAGGDHLTNVRSRGVIRGE